MALHSSVASTPGMPAWRTINGIRITTGMIRNPVDRIPVNRIPAPIAR